MWQGVLGRYYRAVKNLVVDALQESQYPVKKLAYAVKTMKTPESAKRAAVTIQRGKLTRFIKGSTASLLEL